jgi:hypothetical protein
MGALLTMPNDLVRDALVRQVEDARSRLKALEDAIAAYDQAHGLTGPRSSRWRGYVPHRAVAEFLREVEGHRMKFAELRDRLFDGGLMADNKWKERDFKRTIELNLGLAKFTVNGKLMDKRNAAKKLVPVQDSDVIGLPPETPNHK